MNQAVPAPPPRRQRPLRVALTGGPGGGKTTAADLLRRELGDAVIVVPEAATILFSGGFPRVPDPDARCATQRAIFHVQTDLEDVQIAQYADRVLLCDRGTVDSAAYWPPERGGPDGFYAQMGTTAEEQLARYDVVIFFETAAVGGASIESGNPQRIETNAEALALDQRLQACWSAHPEFHFVRHRESFLDKINSALALMQRIIAESADAPRPDGLDADAG